MPQAPARLSFHRRFKFFDHLKLLANINGGVILVYQIPELIRFHYGREDPMNLTEHQAKSVLRDAGVRVPAGGLCKSAEESILIAEALPQSKYVVKAQIRAGGRSEGHFKNDSQSRGGIRFASSLAQVKASSTQMLNNVLITSQTGAVGELVESVYVEEHVQLQGEKYLALTVDRDSGSLMFIASNSGGVQIEALAKQSPDQITRYPVDIRQPEVPSGLAAYFGFENSAATEINELLEIMLATFIDKDATLIELNPIGLNESGELSVLDATIIWDDNALFRQGHEEQMIAYEHLSESEFKAKCLGLNYVELDGNIGTVTAGAGLAMALLDSLHDSGCKPANFMDIPPSSSVDQIRQAISIVLLSKKVDVLLINVIGGGIMRCDAVSDALLLLNERNNERNNERSKESDKERKSEFKEINVPLVVRLAGTNSSLAIQRLTASSPNSFVTTDLAAAIAATADVANSIKTNAEQQKLRSAQSSKSKRWWHRAKKKTESGVL